MARVTIDDSILTNVANSIRTKTETTNSISPLNFASLIESISGGGGEFPSNIIIGEVTPQVALTSYSVSHDKGKAPYFAVLLAKDSRYIKTNYTMIACVGMLANVDDTIKSTLIYNNNYGYLSSFVINYAGVSEMSESIVTFISRGSSYTFKAGITYQYILIFDEV